MQKPCFRCGPKGMRISRCPEVRTQTPRHSRPRMLDAPTSVMKMAWKPRFINWLRHYTHNVDYLVALDRRDPRSHHIDEVHGSYCNSQLRAVCEQRCLFVKCVTISWIVDGTMPIPLIVPILSHPCKNWHFRPNHPAKSDGYKR